MLFAFLPPAGIQANDLDAYVKFEFPYPSTVRAWKSAFLKINTSECFCLSFICCFAATRSSHRNSKLLSSRTLTPQVRHDSCFRCALVVGFSFLVPGCINVSLSFFFKDTSIFAVQNKPSLILGSFSCEIILVLKLWYFLKTLLRSWVEFPNISMLALFVVL